MKLWMNPLRHALILALLLAVSLSPAMAFSISSVKIQPLGNQPWGTAMTVSFIVDFPHAGDTGTFPVNNTLGLSTDLDGAYWEPVLVLDGRETRLPLRSGNDLEVSGMYLSYPASQNVQLFVTLTGRIPENPSSVQDILTVQETEPDSVVRSTAHLEMPAAPFAPVTSISASPTATKRTATPKTFTAIPTGTPAAPSGAAVVISALAGAALFVVRRK